MTRNEYLVKLKKYLNGVGARERDDAISFYIQMFEEAGIDPSDEVPQSFPDPKRVAIDILADTNRSENSHDKISEKKPNTRNNLILILLAIMALPIGLPLGLTVLMIMVSIFFVWIAIGIIGIALIAGSLKLIFLGEISLETGIYSFAMILICIGIVILMYVIGTFVIKWLAEKLSSVNRRQ